MHVRCLQNKERLESSGQEDMANCDSTQWSLTTFMAPSGRQRILPAQSSKKMVASENLLSFVVMKENSHKAHRSVQFTALLKKNSCCLQLTGCNSDPRGWSEGVKQM